MGDLGRGVRAQRRLALTFDVYRPARPNGAGVISIVSGGRQSSVEGAQRAAARSFEVTSVKPNRTGDRSSRFQLLPGGRFVATNTTVRALLQAAYRFHYRPFQIIGGPAWIERDRFDVDGRAGASVPAADIDAMVLVTRSDGRLWPRLRPASKACDRPVADAAGDVSVALFTALQEQLGLRLEPARGPVDVLVIQSAERPEEN